MLIIDFFKRLFLKLFECFIDVILRIVATIRYIIYKILLLCLAILNLGVIGSTILFVLNIKEVLDGMPLTDAKYFIPLICSLIAYFILFNICKVIRPKELLY